MAFPNFRRIYASFRTPEEERAISRAAFFRGLGFAVVCVLMTWLANRPSPALLLPRRS